MELVISDSLSLSEDNLATLAEAPKSLLTSQPCSPGTSRLPINTRIQPKNNLRRDSGGSAEANRSISFMQLIHSVFDQGHKLAELQRTHRCLAASVPNTFSETLMQEWGCIGKKTHIISYVYVSILVQGGTGTSLLPLSLGSKSLLSLSEVQKKKKTRRASAIIQSCD